MSTDKSASLMVSVFAAFGKYGAGLGLLVGAAVESFWPEFDKAIYVGALKGMVLGLGCGAVVVAEAESPRRVLAGLGLLVGHPLRGGWGRHRDLTRFWGQPSSSEWGLE